MIDFIKHLLAKWFNNTPNVTYQKLLEQFDNPDVGMINLPEMLVSFWERLNPNHFANAMNARDMMYVNIETRHENIGELVRLLTLTTAALVQEDDRMIMDIAKDEFMVNRTMTLDDYFSGVGVGAVSFEEGISIIKEAIGNHGRNIENLNPSYHARVLNRMYNDILYITRVIVEQLNEDTN